MGGRSAEPPRGRRAATVDASVTGRLPADVARLLQERATARTARDWQSADALRDQIRALGWEPIDSPDGSSARPATPPADEELPSLLDEPASLDASIVVVVDDHPEDLERFMRGLAAHPPEVSWELLVVANAPVAALELAGTSMPASTILATPSRLGWADAVNLGLRRARGAVAILVDTSLEPAGDIVGPLVAAFDDPTVGIAGGWGVTTTDGRDFVDAPPGRVDAVEAYSLAIRREALRMVGGFDPHYRFYRHADLDLSFAMRDAGWQALRIEPLPAVQHVHRGWEAYPAEERDRLGKRNFYRFLKHWRDRGDLVSPAG